MNPTINRRDFFRAGSGLAAAATVASTARPIRAQTVVPAYDAVTDGEVIEGLTIEGVAVGIVVRANNVTIRRCVIRRPMSDGRNGTGIVVKRNTFGTRIIDVEVDGRNGISHGAGIALHNGCRGVVMTDCYIHHMQRVGLSMGSTTYVEFASPLPEQSEHYIARNLIEYCGTAGFSGDAGSGIVVVGQSHRHTIRENRVRRNFGHGIVLSGSVQGDGSRGTPAFDESPTWNIVSENIVEYNGEEGIRNNGANYTWIRHNFCYANGGLPINVVSLGGTSDSRGVEKTGNREIF
jgi:hypothetical protein